MSRSFISPNDPTLFGSCDSETIQNAVARAVETGCRRVEIPRYNARRDEMKWVVGKAIRLPDDFTLILDNCVMIQESGVYDHMFMNESAWDFDKVHRREDGQRNIAVIGRGNVLLSGGEHNGLLEKTACRMGLPTIWRNTMFMWWNVDGLRVENLSVCHQRWWAMTHLYCRNVVLRDLDFFAVPHVPNMDGIDLRVGCHDFTLENITGRTGDDVIALTALSGTGERRRAVEGETGDICNVKIRNVLADPFTCLVVRLLNEDGNRIHHVDLDGICDVSWFGQKRRPGATLAMGGQGDLYASLRSGGKGETRLVSGRHLSGRGAAVIRFDKCCEDMDFTDVKTFGDNSIAVGTTGLGADLSGVVIDGLFYGSQPKATFAPTTANPQCYRNTLIRLPRTRGELTVKNAEADHLDRLCELGEDLTVRLDVLREPEVKEPMPIPKGAHLYLNGKEQDHA